MAANETLLAANALTTVRKMRALLEIEADDDSQDERIADAINGASQFCETYCDRKFGKATYTQRVAGNGRLRLLLDHYPILEVSSLTSDDSLIPDGDFDILGEEGMLYRDEGWPERWIGNRGLAYEPAERKLNIRLTYTAGYVLPKDGVSGNPRTLPHDLEQACIKLAKLLYSDTDGTAGILILKRERIGDWAVEYDLADSGGSGAVPYDIIQMLNYWRRKA